MTNGERILLRSIEMLKEENEGLKSQLSELIGAIFEFEPEGTYLWDLAEKFDEEIFGEEE